MIRQISFCSLQLLLFVNFSASSSLPFALPEITSYAKVSRNGAGSVDKNVVEQPVNQGRSFQDVTISRSPVYVPSKIPKLRNGEAVDHPSTKYSTLDEEAVAKLDALTSRKQAQDRFRPPASFEHVLAHSNAIKQQSESSGPQSSSSSRFPVPSYATLPQNVYSTNYNYQSDPKPSDDNPPMISSDDYSPNSEDSFSKIPDSYSQPNIYQTDQEGDPPKLSAFESSSSYDDKYLPKPVDFPDHYEHPDDFVDDHYGHHHHHHHHDAHEYPHDLIYDHPPDDHFHDQTTTTEEPEMNDQRLSKRPYSYYYIGKKLWYLPLYFSIYFIIYIAALVLKSITRHKINFPSNLAAAAADARGVNNQNSPNWFDLTKRVLDGIDAYNRLKSPNSRNNS